MSEDLVATLLLIEDNPNDAELTIRALRNQDLATDVLVISDGAEALEFMFGTGPDSQRKPPPRVKLVLLDLKLPKVDGFEVLRRLKGDEQTRPTPVVVLTSSEQERDVIRSYALGCNSYIVKPVEHEAFARTMTAVGSYWLTTNKASA